MTVSPDIVAVAELLLGRPSSRTKREVRFGSKGSLSVRVAQGYWHDFERDEGGDIIDLVRRERNCGYRAALEWLGSDAPPPNRDPVPPDRRDESSRRELAASIWREAVNPIGTLAERYLAGRGLAIQPGIAGPVLRLHPSCPFAGTRRPALIALFRDIHTGQPRAIQRTPLDGQGRRAIDELGKKLAKRSLGPTAGAAIMLTPAARRHIGLAEGIESGIGAIQLGARAVWATGGSGALATFPVLPGLELRVYADADEPGIKAARKLGHRWADAGQLARIFIPDQPGTDFADMGAA